MKKTFLLLCLLAGHAAGAQTPSSQVTVRDDAKVGLIVTGTGNTINTTQIFGKSPEYAELKKALATLEADIQKKAAVCEKMAKDNLPAEYRDGCRSELIALNACRDSVQKIETRFREDVIRLAESFSKMELNSERLRLAKSLFDEGKIREADHVLNAREMKQEGDALLAKKEREQKALLETDSLLRVTADEFALKARLKATDYGDPLRYDSAQIYFEESRRYGETVDNLKDFALLLWKLNQSKRAISYLETALASARSEGEEANLYMNLGIFYGDIQEIKEAEKMYIRSLSIFERLSKGNPALFEPELARTAMSLGNFYRGIQKMEAAEKMLLFSLGIYEREAKANPALFEPFLANVTMNLGIFYKTIQRIEDAEKMYLRSLDIRTRLAKADSIQFDPDLAVTYLNLGAFYFKVQKMVEAEQMYLRSLSIYERLAKSNPSQFEPNLARILINLGGFYSENERMEEAEKINLRSLDIFERLTKGSPGQFEPDLARCLGNLGFFYTKNQKPQEGEKVYLRSLSIFDRLAKASPEAFEPHLAQLSMNLGIFYEDFEKLGEAEKMYLHALHLYDHLAKANPELFASALGDVLGNLSFLYLFAKKYPDAEAMSVRALTLDPAQNWVRASLGHSHLLRGDWPQAKTIYEAYLKNEPDPPEAKKTLAKDWDDLEAAGVSSPAVAMARAWAKE